MQMLPRHEKVRGYRKMKAMLCEKAMLEFIPGSHIISNIQLVF